MNGRILLECLDWKHSKIYNEYIIQRKNNKLMFENDNKVFREDEIEYVKTMVLGRLTDGGHGNEEINRLCFPFINKAYNTLEILLKEIL